MTTIELKLSGLTCGGCITSANRVLLASSNVKEAKVELNFANLLVEDNSPKAIQEIISELADIGFTAVIA